MYDFLLLFFIHIRSLNVVIFGEDRLINDGGKKRSINIRVTKTPRLTPKPNEINQKAMFL